MTATCATRSGRWSWRAGTTFRRRRFHGTASRSSRVRRASTRPTSCGTSPAACRPRQTASRRFARRHRARASDGARGAATSDTGWFLGAMLLALVAAAVYSTVGSGRTHGAGAAALAIVLTLLACGFAGLALLDLVGTASCEKAIRDSGGDCEGHGIVFVFGGGLA